MQWPWTLISKQNKQTSKNQNKTKQKHWTNPNESWKKELIKQRDFQGIKGAVSRNSAKLGNY